MASSRKKVLISYDVVKGYFPASFVQVNAADTWPNDKDVKRQPKASTDDGDTGEHFVAKCFVLVSSHQVGRNAFWVASCIHQTRQFYHFAREFSGYLLNVASRADAQNASVLMGASLLNIFNGKPTRSPAPRF